MLLLFLMLLQSQHLQQGELSMNYSFMDTNNIQDMFAILLS
jgi:hypothetical protein